MISIATDRRRQAAHGTEVAGSTIAGGVGAAFGTAKLRDAYKEEHPAKFTYRLNRLHEVMQRRGVPHARAAKVLHEIERGKPNFRSMVIATTAGTTAAAARNYGQHLDRKAKEEGSVMTKSAFGVDHIAKADLGRKRRNAAATVRRVTTVYPSRDQQNRRMDTASGAAAAGSGAAAARAHQYSRRAKLSREQQAAYSKEANARWGDYILHSQLIGEEAALKHPKPTFFGPAHANMTEAMGHHKIAEGEAYDAGRRARAAVHGSRKLKLVSAGLAGAAGTIQYKRRRRDRYSPS